MATPAAKFLGLQPSDIVEYELSTDKLTEQDINALRSELSDPRFESDYWKEQIQLQLDIGKKAEQQAFAGKGLDFVTEVYLPNRLKDMDRIAEEMLADIEKETVPFMHMPYLSPIFMKTLAIRILNAKTLKSQ